MPVQKGQETYWMPHILGPCQRTKKAVEYEGESKSNCSLCTLNDPQGLGEGIAGTGNQWENWDYPDYSIAEISENTEKSARYLKKLVVTQTPLKDSQY